MDKAVALHQAGKLAEAEALYRTVIGARPDFFHAHHLLGVLLMQQGQHQRALACVDEAIRIEPRFPDAHHSRGKILAELDRQEEATESYKRALTAIDATLRQSPRLAHGHFSRGKLLEELKRPEEAVESYRAALRLDPKHPEALSNCGLALHDLEHIDEALRCFDAALAIRPDSISALLGRGKALRELDRYGESLADFERVLELYPDHIEAIANRAKLLPEFGDCEGAVADLKRALVLNPQRQKTKFQLAALYSMLNRYAEAATLSKDILAQTGELEAPKILRALIHIARGPKSLADTDVLELLDRIDPASSPEPVRRQVEIELAFTRAQVNHSKCRHDEAWRSLVLANRLKRATLDPDAMMFRHSWQEAIRRLDSMPSESEALLPSNERQPIWLFILGASRSGKSSLESLVSSISGVRKGYENRLIEIVRQCVLRESGRSVNTDLSELTPAERARFVSLFGARITELSKGAKVFTCTLPGYIDQLPELVRLIPNLRIVFLKRAVPDLWLRVFMKHYSKKNFPFAYDPHDLRDYIDYYFSMMDKASAKLPQRSIMLSYEELIENPIAARAAIAQLCGLPAPTGSLPAIGDDRGCSLHYRAAMEAALSSAPDAALR
ncbi:MAG: tetratricopeptide repeat protein [Rhodospirillaceae bacterium]|nr:tetratricopeptide repeat protein [Rhodospirillaceae bacterium]